MRAKILETEAVLILCDISGYTRFMAANREALAHSYVIILELMKALTGQVRSPFTVAKLEGDAVFLYARLPAVEQERKQMMQQDIQAMIARLFAAYDARLLELQAANVCRCEACRNLGSLQLKMIVHCGAALFHRIGKFSELSGVEVILAHRLLKNSLPLQRYAMFTEAAYQLTVRTGTLDWQEGAEQYEDLGITRTFTFVPPYTAVLPHGETATQTSASLLQKARDIFWKIFKGRAMQFGLIRTPFFRYLHEGRS